MPAFGAKTLSDILDEVVNNPSLSVLDVTGSASIKIRSLEALESLADPLKAHKGIKKLVLGDCEVTDAGCQVIADILKVNDTIEDLDLHKNKISSAGAILLADGLTENRSVRTLNLMEQGNNSFGEDCLEHFCTMYNNNITLTKITWRLTSRKSFMLAKLQTRNIEIAKRLKDGKDITGLLPDHMKPDAPVVDADGAVVDKRTISRKKSTVAEMEMHLDSISKEVGEQLVASVAEVDSGDDGAPADASPP